LYSVVGVQMLKEEDGPMQAAWPECIPEDPFRGKSFGPH
jgi:hypothetical protein